MQITHDEIHYKKPLSFSENALKLTYSSVKLRRYNPRTPASGKGTGRQGGREDKV